VCCGVLQCVAECCFVLQCVVVSCIALKEGRQERKMRQFVAMSSQHTEKKQTLYNKLKHLALLTAFVERERESARERERER